jgi:glycerol-3-phosphate dehydrogenase
VLQRQLGLKADGLVGAWQFWDGQMDEQALGGWVERQARSAGVVIHDNCEVQRVDAFGDVAAVVTGAVAPSLRTYTWVVNACGPWAVELLERSGISSPVKLDLVRGSHLLVPPPPGIPLPEEGLFVEVPGSRRIAFLLPYKGELLVGTTEKAQQLNEPARASPLEQEELLGLVSHYLPAWLAHAQQHGRWFAGLRPIVRSRADVSSASREADVQRNGRLLTVLGGKWTTARALAERLADAAPFNGQP